MGNLYSNTLRLDVIDTLHRETNLTSEQIRRLYQDYQDICYNSKSWPKSFHQRDLSSLYDETGDGAADGYAKLLFNVMDADGNGTIDFREYVLTASMYFNHDERQKLTWLFSFFDLDKSGYIERDELQVVVEALLELIPSGIFEVTLTAEDITEEILAEVDTNGDNRISRDEFVRGATSCATFRQLLKQTLKLARKPFLCCQSIRKNSRGRSRTRSSTMTSQISAGSL